MPEPYKRLLFVSNQELIEEGGWADQRISQLLDGREYIYENQSDFGLDSLNSDTYLGDSGDILSPYLPEYALDDPLAGFSTQPDSPITMLRFITEALHAVCAIKAAGSTTRLDSEKIATAKDAITVDPIRRKSLSRKSPVSESGYAGRRPSRTRSAEGDYYGTNLMKSKGFGLVPETVRRGDTIQDIAIRRTGDISNYRFLAVINDLKPPYIDEIGQPEKGILGVGDTIMVPARVSEVTTETSSLIGKSASLLVHGGSLFPEANYVTNVDRFFGIDIYFDWDRRDFKVNKRLDLSIALREAQTRQFLKIYTDTERGSWRLDRSFGFLRPPGFMSTRIMLGMSEMALRRQMTRDPRITSVVSLQMRIYGNIMIAVARIRLEYINKSATITTTTQLS